MRKMVTVRKRKGMVNGKGGGRATFGCPWYVVVICLELLQPMATFVESVIHCGPARNTEPRPRVRVLVEDEGLKLLISQSHHRIVFRGATKLELLARIVNEGHTLGNA